MSGAGPRRPQPVSVEEWDDEAQVSIPGTRITANANVAVKRDISTDSGCPSPVLQYKYHDGTDSGYVSKAPTVSSTGSSSRRRDSMLKLDTAVPIERERKPYAMTATPRESERPTVSRGNKEKEAKEQAKPAKKQFCHKHGECWVCDQYGLHFDPKNPPPGIKKKETTKPPTPAPQANPQANTQAPRSSIPRPKVEDVARPPSRRMSSNQARPNLYTSTPVQAGPYPQYPQMHNGWPAGAGHPPSTLYSQYPYVAPGTPVGYIPPQTPVYYNYEPQPVFDDYPEMQPKQVRRLSVLGQERPVIERRPSRSSTMLERTVSREQKPPLTAQRSSRNIDADKKAMPPPPRPQHVTTANPPRPRPRRSSTYNDPMPNQRLSRYVDSESESDSDEELDPRTLVASRQPPASPRRPPSSWKPPTAEAPERPQLVTKSQSYHEGGSTVQVASSRAIPRRRTTESVPPVKSQSKEEVAEAYIKKRGSIPPVELTAENLKVLKNVPTRQVSDQRSESGSTNSHLTQNSSSKDSSSGRGRMVTTSNGQGHSRGTSMNINVGGYNLTLSDEGAMRGEAIPVRLDVGGVQISMGNSNKENLDYYKRPQKQLERTPSMSSRPSRRSLTQGSLVSAATNNQRREKDEILAIEGARESREYSRRSSYVDEEQRELLRSMSARSSRQTSRNASKARPAADELPVRPRPSGHRSSVDYSHRDEPVM